MLENIGRAVQQLFVWVSSRNLSINQSCLLGTRKKTEISTESERSLPLSPLFIKNYFSIDKYLGLASIIDACLEGQICSGMQDCHPADHHWWLGIHSHQ